jgi:hypothetical protein
VQGARRHRPVVGQVRWSRRVLSRPQACVECIYAIAEKDNSACNGMTLIFLRHHHKRLALQDMAAASRQWQPHCMHDSLTAREAGCIGCRD